MLVRFSVEVATVHHVQKDRFVNCRQALQASFTKLRRSEGLESAKVTHQAQTWRDLSRQAFRFNTKS